MAPSRICTANGLKVVVTVVFIVFITCLPPSISVGTLNSDQGERWLQQSNRVLLGSKPPSCVNKCLSCGPCMATLVIPSHSHQGKKISRSTASYHGDEDDSYYLLSWKCKCGDKLFQP